ncbi:MAG: dimethylarginine dimethylaminohydrolase family protein [Promethearchaeota archaeon]|jgi:dimethylargininase
MPVNQAIVKQVSQNFQYGITTSELEPPDYELAFKQHCDYIKALRKCGVKVKILEADDKFPDSTFIEDTAVVNEIVAIITNFGVPSRRGEEISIHNILKDFYQEIVSIKNPGTLEGGDVLRVENQYFIGISKRTNRKGAIQLSKILKAYGFNCLLIPLKNILHLKTGVAYLGDNNILASGELINTSFFSDFKITEVSKIESYATNCIRVNDYVLMAHGFRNLKKSILDLGYEVIELNMSEFRKMDGGPSCLSLRF